MCKATDYAHKGPGPVLDSHNAYISHSVFEEQQIYTIQNCWHVSVNCKLVFSEVNNCIA